jgi:IS30 family transposase
MILQILYSIFFPIKTKGSSLEDITDEQIKAVADKLNHRPRKILGFKTPFEVFYGKILEAS